MCLRTAAIAALCVFAFKAMATEFNGDFYHQRYGLKDTQEKLVDNHGDGYTPLYGTRNVREVLKGILYRGGANNRYNRNHPRDNSNPLPNEGLENLCEEGFKTAVYLYDKNFRTAPPVTDCQSIRGPNRLDYLQRTWSTQYRAVLELVYGAIQDQAKAPLYLHCWNGWHASGMLSAFSLIQFCGMSNAHAVQYWIKNTDGSGDHNFQAIKDRIAQFKAYPDLMIDAATRARICPN